MNRKKKNLSAKRQSSLPDQNVILLDKPTYICILNYTTKRVIIRQNKSPVHINYIEEIFPAIFSYIKQKKHKYKTVSCIWTPHSGYLIEFNMNTCQLVKDTIQTKCHDIQAYFKSLVKKVFVSTLNKLDNIFYQHYFQLGNIFEVNHQLWTDHIPDECKKFSLCQVPAQSPILTLGNYQEILLDEFHVNMNLPVQSSFTTTFIQYILQQQQHNLKKSITHSKDLISFLMSFKMGFYSKNNTQINVSDFIWKDHNTISVIYEEESMVKNIDFRKLYFIQDKLDKLNLISAAIQILGLFLLGKSITVEQT
jgi:hypothetical protein